MTAATVTTHTIASGATVATARDNLRDWLISDVGLTHVKSYLTSGTEYATFQSPDGVGFITLFVSSSYVWQLQVHDAFDSGTNTRSGNTFSTSSSNVSSSGASVAVTMISHPELTLIRLTSGSQALSLGWVRPSGKPAWWSATRPYLISLAATNSGFSYASSYASGLAARRGALAFASPQLGGRAIRPGVEWSSSTDVIGQSSNDLATVASSGMALFDTAVVTAGVEEYLLLEQISTEGLCVRSV